MANRRGAEHGDSPDRPLITPMRTHSVNPRSCLAAVVLLGMLARTAPAQAAPSAASPVGVWRGTSSCQVRPSPCNDEIVIYRITGAKASDSISVDARKLVSAREEDMGVLACRLEARGASFTCTMRNGVWHFSVRRDSLVGVLRLPDSTKYREVRAARSR